MLIEDFLATVLFQTTNEHLVRTNTRSEKIRLRSFVFAFFLHIVQHRIVRTATVEPVLLGRKPFACGVVTESEVALPVDW